MDRHCQEVATLLQLLNFAIQVALSATKSKVPRLKKYVPQKTGFGNSAARGRIREAGVGAHSLFAAAFGSTK
jgi:hypothetical protein